MNTKYEIAACRSQRERRPIRKHQQLNDMCRVGKKNYDILARYVVKGMTSSSQYRKKTQGSEVLRVQAMSKYYAKSEGLAEHQSYVENML